MSINKKVQKNCFIEFKKQAKNIKTEKELKTLEVQFKRNKKCFGEFKNTIDAFFITKHGEFKKARLNSLIKPFEAVEPLYFNIKGIETVEKKVEQIKEPKLKFGLSGLLNLIKDENNLVYNDLKTRQKIINDLNLFKSLKFFKMAYVSRFDLKKEYRYLSYKNGAKKGFSRLYFIEHGLYVLKTLETDGLSLKAIYINNKAKNLVNDFKSKKTLSKDPKFNKSSVDAWKSLEREDNILFYSYCNENGLDRKNRQLLKSIRKMEGGQTFSCYLEEIEEVINDLEKDYASKSKITLPNGSVIPNYEYLGELEEVKHKYWALTEEHNSNDIPTYLDDYAW